MRFVFGIPGEETLDLIDALDKSPIRFVSTRHEQGAAFMADVWGRLTGEVGVCASTLGPGATNLITGVADAYLDRAPMLAIAGQGAGRRLHKQSHQIIDLAGLFDAVTKRSKRVAGVEAIGELVAEALTTALAPPPGPCFLELPEDIAGAASGDSAIRVAPAPVPQVADSHINEAVEMLVAARRPLVLIGNGAVRAQSTEALRALVEALGAPFSTTFMAKGAISDEHPLALPTTGLSDQEHARCGFDRADLVIAIGYDLVEFDPAQWHRDPEQAILHLDLSPAEVDRAFIPQLSLVGDLADTLARLSTALRDRDLAVERGWAQSLRDRFDEHRRADSQSDAFPVKPQRLLHDLRNCLAPEDILVSDVGAHKVWIAHQWPTYVANTCIISNGFAAMGIGLPGAIAAKLAFPDRTVVAATGDAGFLMNAQELETALRLRLALVVLVWNDSGYGLIEWHQEQRFGRSNDVAFANPDLVAFAESFGARGFRVERAADLATTLRAAIACNTVAVVDCPIDYRENMRLTESLGRLTCSN